jgi:integrase
MTCDSATLIREQESMPKKRPQFIVSEISRHGRRRWYFRRGKGARIRLPDEYDTPEFWNAYHKALTGEELPPTSNAKGRAGTLKWLIDAYRQSGVWQSLALETRRRRERIFLGMIEKSGDKPFAKITRGDIVRGRDKRAATSPASANHFLKAVAGLFGWALEAEHVKLNPCDGVKLLSLKSDGHRPWTDEEIERFRTRWPLGSRERLALEILIGTGLRRGDAATLGRQHVKDDVVTIRTQKTGAVVSFPILPELAEAIATADCGDLAFVAKRNGAPLTVSAFSAMFDAACKSAGVNASPHGLRKAAARRLAEAGASVAQLEAVFGWTGGAMASLYTRSADRSRLAREAMSKLAKSETGTNNPSPIQKVRDLSQKA